MMSGRREAEGRGAEQSMRDGSMWEIARGVCGASVSALLLTLAMLSTLPLAAFVAFWSLPPSLDRTYPVVFDYRLENPAATVPLLPSPHRLTSVKGSNQHRLLRPGQVYEFSLILQLPESTHNTALGVFQVTATGLSASGNVLSSASLPCVLRHSSFPIRAARAMFFALPVLWGLVDEHQVLRVRLLRSKEQSDPLAAVSLVLEPSARASLSSGIPQIYDAKLRVRALLWGSSPWLALSSLSAFAWMVALLSCVQLVGLCICCRAFLIPTLPLLFSRGPEEVSMQENGNSSPAIGMPVGRWPSPVLYPQYPSSSSSERGGPGEPGRLGGEEAESSSGSNRQQAALLQGRGKGTIEEEEEHSPILPSASALRQRHTAKETVGVD